MNYTYLRTEADLQRISTLLLDLVSRELESWQHTAEMEISFDGILDIVMFLRDADVRLPEDFKEELKVTWKTVGAYE
jgi:hypothetical protein|tara:strand:- start:381 stop:611 length:231 start_codon:yes stop_codon:yes gene_type:complete